MFHLCIQISFIICYASVIFTCNFVVYYFPFNSLLFVIMLEDYIKWFLVRKRRVVVIGKRDIFKVWRRVVVMGKRDIFKVRRRVVVIGGLTGSGSRPPPIFSRTILSYRYPSPPWGWAKPQLRHHRLQYATDCRFRIAVMRWRRDLSHACMQPVARTCATLALEDFCSDRTDRPALPERVCRSPSTSARPVVLAREGHPSLVNRPLLTEAWVALVLRWRWLAGEAGDPAGKIHGARTRPSAKSLPALPSASASKRQWGPPWSKAATIQSCQCGVINPRTLYD